MSDQGNTQMIVDEIMIFNGLFDIKGYWVSDNKSDLLIWGVYNGCLPVMIKSISHILNEMQAIGFESVNEGLIEHTVQNTLTGNWDTFEWTAQDEFVFISDDFTRAVVVPTFAINANGNGQTSIETLSNTLELYGYCRRMRTSGAIKDGLYGVVSDLLVTFTRTGDSSVAPIQWRVSDGCSTGEYTCTWRFNEQAIYLMSSEVIKEWMSDAFRLSGAEYVYTGVHGHSCRFVVRNHVSSFNGRASNDRLMMPVVLAVLSEHADEFINNQITHNYTEFVIGMTDEWYLSVTQDMRSKMSQSGFVGSTGYVANSGYDLKGTPLEQLMSASSVILDGDSQ